MRPMSNLACLRPQTTAWGTVSLAAIFIIARVNVTVVEYDHFAAAELIPIVCIDIIADTTVSSAIYHTQTLVLIIFFYVRLMTRRK